jgi:Na+/phosphate symporter
MLLGFVNSRLMNFRRTIGIILVLASHGLLSLEASIPLLLGSNLGTAVTAIVPPDRIMEEVKPQTMYLNRRFIQTPSLGLNLAKQETLRLGNLVREMGYEIILPFTEKSGYSLAAIGRIFLNQLEKT